MDHLLDSNLNHQNLQQTNFQQLLDLLLFHTNKPILQMNLIVLFQLHFLLKLEQLGFLLFFVYFCNCVLNAV